MNRFMRKYFKFPLEALLLLFYVDGDEAISATGTGPAVGGGLSTRTHRSPPSALLPARWPLVRKFAGRVRWRLGQRNAQRIERTKAVSSAPGSSW